MLITWTILIFCKVTLSRTIKSSSGLSKSKISIGYPSYYYNFFDNFSLSVNIVPSEKTYPGNLTLQSSHSNAFQQYVFTLSDSFFDFLEFSHSRRHSRWIWLMVPAHLQGDINGLLFSFSSPKHILQIFYSATSLAFFSNSNWSFYFWSFYISCIFHYFLDVLLFP